MDSLGVRSRHCPEGHLRNADPHPDHSGLVLSPSPAQGQGGVQREHPVVESVQVPQTDRLPHSPARGLGQLRSRHMLSPHAGGSKRPPSEGCPRCPRRTRRRSANCSLAVHFCARNVCPWTDCIPHQGSRIGVSRGGGLGVDVGTVTLVQASYTKQSGRSALA